MPGVMLGLSPYLNLWQIIVEDSFFSGGSRYTQDISSIICTSKAYGSDKEQQQQKQKITYDSMVYFSPI